MVENTLSVSVFCICGVVLAVLLRQYCREQSLMIALGICTAVMGAFLLYVEPIIGEIRELLYLAEISDDYLGLIFKAMAICIITQITCDICRDSGELAIASAAELWGRGTLAFMSIPMIRSLMEMINEIL